MLYWHDMSHSQEWEKGGLNFYSEDNEFIQVGTWGYDSGKELSHILIIMWNEL